MRSALAALHAGRFAEAERHYRKILRASPQDGEALHGLGIVLLQLGQPARAIGFFERALRLPQASSHVHNNLATAFNALGRPVEALDSLERAVALAPKDATLHYNRANTLMTLGRNQEALDAFTLATELVPDMAPAWQNRAIVETRLGLLSDALVSCDHQIALAPNHAKGREARGEALMALGRPAEAIAEFEAAAAKQPSLALAHMNKAHALDVTGRVEEAKAAIEIALREDPELVLAHCNAASLHLSTGDFARGWREYEWRWRKDDFKPHLRDLGKKLWLGDEDLKGRTILLHAEQGFGDTLQFCRYVPMVAALGAHVVLEVQRALVPLMGSLAGHAMLIARGDVLPEFDAHCPLMSLPLAFGTQTFSIPWDKPYISAEPARVQLWRKRLGPASGPRLGLAWSGARNFGGDAFRSAPLSSWAALIQPEYEAICLQKDVREADAAAAARLGVRLFSAEIEDFGDVAALIELMDLTISVDSAPAHLAGAMGKKLWVMLPFNAEWRWRRSGDITAWYPSARLFRQAAQLDWSSLAEQAAGKLTDALIH